jgi:hypothetical protein
MLNNRGEAAYNSIAHGAADPPSEIILRRFQNRQ